MWSKSIRSSKRQAKKSRVKRRRTARLEALEARQVLAAFAQAGFEAPVQPANQFEQASGTGGGDLAGSAWNFSPAAGITRNTSGFQNGGIQAPEGSQFALIQRAGTISQAGTDFIPGNAYQITVSTAARAGLAGNNLILEIDGRPILGGQVGLNQFVDVTSGYFVATSATPTLTIRTTNPLDGDRTTFIDNVRVTDLGVISTPTLFNPSFEGSQDSTPASGYGVVDGFGSTTSNTGSNAAGGTFLGGATVPDGARVGFIQRAGTLSAQIVGLTPGESYSIQYFENARNATAAHPELAVDGTTLVPTHLITQSPTFKRMVSAPFTAIGTTALLELKNTDPSNVDQTALFDDISIVAPVPVIPEGGFETPVQPPNQFEQGGGTGSGSLAGSVWTYSGSAGITRNISPFQNGNRPAPEGVQHGLIQGSGTISQTITGFVPGETYSLSLETMARQTNQFGSDLEVVLNAGLPSEIVLIDIPEVTFTSFTTVTSPAFTAANASYTLTLRATRNGGTLAGDRTTFVDFVRFNTESAPIVGANTYSTDEDTSITSPPAANLLAGATDAENNTFTITGFNGTMALTGTTANGATVTLQPNGDFSYDPTTSATFNALPENTPATDSFTFTVTDSSGLTTTSTVMVDITGVNDAPAADAGGDYPILEGQGVTLDASASTDPDTGDTLSYEFDLDNNGTFDFNTAGDPTLTLTWAQLESFGINNGDADGTAYAFAVRVTDVAGLQDTDTGTITVTNVAPVATVTPTEIEALRDREVTFTVTADDPSSADDTAGFTYQADLNGNGTIEVATEQNTTGVFTVSYPTLGSRTFNTFAIDQDGATSAAAPITINVVPVGFDPDTNEIVADGTPGMTNNIVFSPANGGVQVRYNNTFYGPFATNGTTRIAATGADMADTIIIHSLDIDSSIDGGGGNDYIAGSLGDDTINGGAGNDQILTSSGDDYVDGGADNDFIDTRDGDDVIFGGEGNDEINAGVGNDLLDGGAGNDILFGHGGNDIIIGRSGDDTISGYTGNDVILAGSGMDFLSGSDGNDLLIGGTEADRILGETGSDDLAGGSSSREAEIEAVLDAMMASLGSSLMDSDMNGIAAALTEWRTSGTHSGLGTDFDDDGSVDDLTGGFIPSESSMNVFHTDAADIIRDFRTGTDTEM